MLTGKSQSGAFTLVELMVSVALASIMMGIVTTVFFTAGRLTREADSRVEMYAEARFILEKMSAEIASAEYHTKYRDDTGGPIYIQSGAAASRQYDSDKDYRRGGIAFTTTDIDGKSVLVIYTVNLKDSDATTVTGLVRLTQEITAAATDLKTFLDTDPVDTDVDATAGLAWQTMSENVLSVEYRCYSDVDRDGRFYEDPGYPTTDGVDNDQDGGIDEDLSSALGTLLGGIYGNDWSGGRIAQGLGAMPCLIEIRMVVKDTEDRERRLFTRFVQVTNYLGN